MSNEDNGINEKPKPIGAIIVGILAAIAAIINAVVLLTIPFETLQPQIFLGITLALLIGVGIILIGFLWGGKKTPPTVNVANIAATVGTACTPNNSLRIARQPGTPPVGPWVLTSTWVESTPGTKLVPSSNYLSNAFGEETQTSNFTCQTQKCTAGTWANVGAPRACNVVTATRIIQFNVAGQTWLPWTPQNIAGSYATGSFQ